MIETKASTASPFAHYLRTGRRIEQKFNRWHDPKDGRFTFAENGSGASGSAILNQAARRTPDHQQGQLSGASSSLPKAYRGPFELHASRSGKDGDVARAINKLVTDPRANVSLALNDQTVKVRRMDGSRVELSMAGGQFVAHGYFATMQGRQGVSIHVQDQGFTGLSKLLGSKMTSFPREIAVFSRSGQLVYTLDRPITGSFGGIPINKKAGIFYVSKPKR